VGARSDAAQLRFLELGAEPEHWTDNTIGPAGFAALAKVRSCATVIRC
jgi:hypothetical protein